MGRKQAAANVAKHEVSFDDAALVFFDPLALLEEDYIDVLHWLRSQGRGYQSRINAILRKEMLHSAKSNAE